MVVFIAFGVMSLHQDNEIEHLKRVEWLYRWSRIGRTYTEEYQDFLFPCAEARCVDVRIFGSEAVESPDECQFEITGHVANFHPVILTCVADSHGRRPFVEYVIDFQIKFTASFFTELPFDTCIDFPYTR